MHYRVLGKTGETISILGFGAMRLPIRGTESDVDEDLATELIRRAVDAGVNYVDTGYPYHGGTGEAAVGKALAGGYRARVQLATKLPTWAVQSLDDCDRFFEQQLTRLDTDRLDFYLLHCLDAKTWARMRGLGVLRWAEKARVAGRFRHFGFSFHDDLEAFTKIVDDYDWSFCQIQYNCLCEDVQAGRRGLQYAATKGLGVIVMEPLFGGTLANPPESVRSIWESRPRVGTPVDVALQWLWDQPEVSTVLSGMNRLDHLQENVASAERAAVGSLGVERRKLIARVVAEYQRLSPVGCTKCGYCKPCPSGVDIPVNFEFYNQSMLMGGNAVTLCRNLYLMLPDSEKAAACQQCGQCEDRCPQQLPVRELLAKAVSRFQ